MIRKNIFVLTVSMICLVNIFFISASVAGASESPARKTSHCRLDVAVDPATKKVTGTMDILAENGRELVIYRNGARLKEFRVSRIKKKISEDNEEDPLIVRSAGPIQLKYEIKIENSEDNILNDQEIVLKTGWHPVVDGFSTYEVRVTLPKGFIAITEGNIAEMHRQGDKAVLTSQLDRPYDDSITLVASKRFVVSHDALDSIDIYTYFFSEHAGQTDAFIEDAKHYLKMYQALIGKYPYKRFSIVEHSMSSAFSMPTFILMSEKYISAGNTEETPLGHEVLHQWFGNAVFADYDRGNWHEGLTIYLADHLQEEARKKDMDCRKRILMGYENYVRDNNEFPLSEFTERFDYASRSIGYGKSAMVFHMLRKRYGDEVFYGTIRRFVHEHSFHIASWDDLKEAFENTTGQDLTSYFQQWVYDTGIADLDISDVQMYRKAQGYEVRFSILQKGNNYRISMPVTFYFNDNKQVRNIVISEPRTSFTFMFDKPPTEIVLDEEYDVFRRLSIKEEPPTIEKLITDDKSIIVSPVSDSGLYRELIAAFGEKGAVLQFMRGGPDTTRKYGGGRVNKMTLRRMSNEEPRAKQSLGRKRTPQQRVGIRDGTAASSRDMQPGFRRQCLQRNSQRLTDNDLASASLLIIGLDNPILKRLRIEPPALDAGFRIIVMKNPLNVSKVVAIAAGKSSDEIAVAQGQIADYRKYSILSFNKGKLVNKSLEKSDNGIRRSLANTITTATTPLK